MELNDGNLNVEVQVEAGYEPVTNDQQGQQDNNNYNVDQSHHLQSSEGWHTFLFGCFEDPGNALVTMFFPCVTFGRNAEIVDQGQTSCETSGLLYGLTTFLGVSCAISRTYRTKLRSQYGLMESPASDWITHSWFFECCALCQEYRELKIRGMDPSQGWQGNAAKNQRLQYQQVAMMVPQNQTMKG